jgi:hypothetical protein
MQIHGSKKIELFFRAAARLDIDQSDLKRFNQVINEKLYDLVLIGQATAKANHRDIIEPWDLPITIGLQEGINEYEKLKNEGIAMDPIFEQITGFPSADLGYSQETEKRLPLIVGGLSVTLAHLFKVLDPKNKNPGEELWQQAQSIFNLLL